MKKSRKPLLNPTIHLNWHGPYAITDGMDVPNLLTAKPSAAKLRGVYLWTVLIGDE